MSGYSARVDMHLHLPGGEILSVAQSGPEFIILSAPAFRPPCHGVLEINVDGSISRYPWHLKNGINGRRIDLSQCDPGNRIHPQE